MSKDLLAFLKIGVAQAILSLSEITRCSKELSNKCFILENTSLEFVSTKLGEVSLYPNDFLDFKE